MNEISYLPDDKQHNNPLILDMAAVDMQIYGIYVYHLSCLVKSPERNDNFCKDLFLAEFDAILVFSLDLFCEHSCNHPVFLFLFKHETI